MASQQHDRLTDFDRGSFTFGGKDRTVFRIGDGPGVVVMAEMPGITPRFADFARHVRATYPDVPIILHSSRPENEALAHSVLSLFNLIV